MRFVDHPGHFPGDPLVPGAALLDAIADALPRPLVGLERVRFLAPVRPGDEAALEHRIDGDRVSFTLRVGDVTVLRGVGSLG